MDFNGMEIIEIFHKAENFAQASRPRQNDARLCREKVQEP